MKMNKILAAGIAATLAVTSMAAVASAEEVTFEMGQTKGTIKLAQSGGVELSGYTTTSGANEYLGIAADDTIIVKVNPGDAEAVTGVTLTVTGIKGDRNSSSKAYTYKFTNYADAACTQPTYGTSGEYWALTAYASTAPVDSFVPGQFVEITKISVDVTATTTVETAAEYDAWGNSVWGTYNGATLAMVQAFSVGADAANPTGLAVTNEINNAVYGMWGYNYGGEKSTTVDYPFMAITDNGDKTLTRQEIGLLSYAGAWVAVNGGNNGGLDGDQTYDDNGFGTNPNDFAGLASQVGDFFNKQTNGTITFKFTTAAASTSTSWQTGGVPSTQVGIKNTLGAATANDFALFFNYDQTGSLQAVTSIDANAGTVTFDIADVLDALDGKTIGVIDNIFYGMTKGVTYDDLGTGLKVESITLAYDEDATDDADIEDEDDDDDAVIDDDDDVVIEDDDDDAVIDDEDDDDDVVFDDDDDADVDGDIDEPITPADDDDDANPGTGVALAVVPALVAAAAVVVSKKRK